MPKVKYYLIYVYSNSERLNHSCRSEWSSAGYLACSGAGNGVLIVERICAVFKGIYTSEDVRVTDLHVNKSHILIGEVDGSLTDLKIYILMFLFIFDGPQSTHMLIDRRKEHLWCRPFNTIHFPNILTLSWSLFYHHVCKCCVILSSFGLALFFF